MAQDKSGAMGERHLCEHYMSSRETLTLLERAMRVSVESRMRAGLAVQCNDVGGNAMIQRQTRR